jgi:hypothetical protein
LIYAFGKEGTKKKERENKKNIIRSFENEPTRKTICLSGRWGSRPTVL